MRNKSANRKEKLRNKAFFRGKERRHSVKNRSISNSSLGHEWACNIAKAVAAFTRVKEREIAYPEHEIMILFDDSIENVLISKGR